MYVQFVKEKKMDTTINSNTNYRREMKHVPVNIDYNLFQFDTSKFVIGVHPLGGSVPNLNFQCKVKNMTKNS